MISRHGKRLSRNYCQNVNRWGRENETVQSVGVGGWCDDWCTMFDSGVRKAVMICLECIGIG